MDGFRYLRVIPPEYLDLNFLLTHTFTEDQLKVEVQRFIGTYVVEFEIISIAKPRYFPLNQSKENIVINYENKYMSLVVDQITLENLFEFQGITCWIIQGIYWVWDNVSPAVGYNVSASDSDSVTSSEGGGLVLRKHTIRDTIQALFNQRAHYKAIGSPLQEVFNLIMNSVYWKTIIKDIKTTNEYIPNELIPEYFENKYYLIQGIYSVNEEQSIVKLKKGTVYQFRNYLLWT